MSASILSNHARALTFASVLIALGLLALAGLGLVRAGAPANDQVLTPMPERPAAPAFDLKDPKDPIHEFLRTHSVQILKPQMATGSKVYYAGLDGSVR